MSQEKQLQLEILKKSYPEFFLDDDRMNDRTDIEIEELYKIQTKMEEEKKKEEINVKKLFFLYAVKCIIYKEKFDALEIGSYTKQMQVHQIEKIQNKYMITIDLLKTIPNLMMEIFSEELIAKANSPVYTYFKQHVFSFDIETAFSDIWLKDVREKARLEDRKLSRVVGVIAEARPGDIKQLPNGGADYQEIKQYFEENYPIK